MKLFSDFAKRPIVDIAFVKKRIKCSNHYASLVVYRLQKRGILKKIAKNKFTAIDNIYVVATQLFSPSYLSFWSASMYLGSTNQILSTLQIVTTKKRKTISFQNYTIKFIVLPKRYFFGFTRVETTDGTLFVAEPEKLIIDSMLRPREMGNFDEIIAIVMYFTIDVKKLISYLLAIKNISVTKRVGYLLEKYKNIDISSSISINDRNYISLNPSGKKSTRIIPKWRLKI